jgi:hypothetical protein
MVSTVYFLANTHLNDRIKTAFGKSISAMTAKSGIKKAAQPAAYNNIIYYFLGPEMSIWLLKACLCLFYLME